MSASPPRADTAIRAVVTVLAALVLSLLAPPANWHWVHWFAYLPMLWVLRDETPNLNRKLAWLYGAVGVGWIFRWLVDTIIIFSNIPSVGAWAVLALFAIVFGLPYIVLWSAVHPLRRRLGDGWILALPALQVVIEYLSMYLLLFPYNHGVSQYRFPFTWQLASVTGIWGVTYLLFFVNCAFGEAIYRRREGRPFPWRWASAAVAAWALVVIFGGWRYDRIEAALREAPVVRVAQIQSRMTMEERMSRSARRSFEDWVRATAAIPAGAVDLVVWPEGACPYPLDDGGGATKTVAELARRGGYEMVIGGGAREVIDGERRAFNSTYLVDPSGEIKARYDKMVPLPFGEYMPLGDRLPFLKGLIAGIGDFRAGTEPVVFEGAKFKYATPICYEAILSGVCRRFPTADVLVNVTNDAWFGDTAAPHQHAMLSAVRAIELGVPIIRSAYTGTSMIIEPHGVIHSETRPFTDVNRVVGVRVARFPTIYAVIGDSFVLLCALGLGAAWFVTGRRGGP